MLTENKILTEKSFLDGLLAFADEQRQLIEAECSGFATGKAESEKRVEQAQNDYQFFVNTYFPHYIKGDPSEFHEYIFNEIPQKVGATAGCKEPIAAPRGEAKSTLVTQLFSLWCIVTNRKHFIGIIMDAIDQSSQMLEAIKVELESNPRLIMDFPEATGGGRVWNVQEIITANHIKVKIAGSGKKLRGWRFGQYRPDLIILDDIENDENVRKPEQRQKLQDWINKAVLKLGAPDGSMDVIYIGTILHYDSVLARIMRSPTWNGKKFAAIKQWPDNMDLWEKWEEIFTNQGRDAADKFYNRNEAAMLAGAVVSWPSMRPLKLLMEMRADDHHAFDCEMQNDPTNSENALFDTITFWVQHIDRWQFFGACDPSLGKANKARDPSAILVGGYDRSTGFLDTVEASIRRRKPDKIISDIIEFQKEYKCMAWGIETVQFQEFLYTELVKRSAKAGIPVPAVPITQSTDKVMRIESLQPHVSNGLIRLHKKHTTLFEQLRHFPEADHDDGPDALEMLWNLALARAQGLRNFAKPSRPRRSRLKHYGALQ